MFNFKYDVYENRKNNIFNVLSSVVCFMMENTFCVDHSSLQQDKIYSANKLFESTTFHHISVIGVPSLLMDIMYYHGILNIKKSTVIFICYIKWVYYYLSKCFISLKINQAPLVMCYYE